jgi:hypothetical protein
MDRIEEERCAASSIPADSILQRLLETSYYGYVRGPASHRGPRIGFIPIWNWERDSLKPELKPSNLFTS